MSNHTLHLCVCVCVCVWGGEGLFKHFLAKVVVTIHKNTPPAITFKQALYFAIKCICVWSWIFDHHMVHLRTFTSWQYRGTETQSNLGIQKVVLDWIIYWRLYSSVLFIWRLQYLVLTSLNNPYWLVSVTVMHCAVCAAGTQDLLQVTNN
jgi:hypothetical protein